ncbi:malto-oligosyltrehalose synthase [Tropicimonas sediminicola]|uniref:Maltooligosyl trehalose synthase n=1 Tax=Tropicimonas sediminicola TaxID=1031541 RepID=A0A239JB72_9RHOB|nr:malto-oligosyltrehalose synthase [Tropicimonas sediminicola]SNT02728.1 maltooligosyl trehalose synthase [Tropicimonas sediminicola]
MFPTATYRLQLRGGVDFAAAETWLPHLASLGISHLYLSPIFTAQDGSTHGYDIIDPGEIDPALGGRAGFSSLARAARAQGLGLILDIVPNHTAFTPANPWLRDVLRYGEHSRFAHHFDIDWQAGPLVLPLLDGTFDQALERGDLSLRREAGRPVLEAPGLTLPLAPGTDISRNDRDALRAVHDAQSWRLTDWRYERDGVTHRRFFNVTSLIGMQVERAEVFEDMHALLFDLVDAGEVDGVRVDHVDGLADPTGYLRRLAANLGPVPIWVEKILVGEEKLPDWPVAGTTGYEAARAIACVLTDEAGWQRLHALWQEETGRDMSFREALAEAKDQVLREELAAELHELIALCKPVLGDDPETDAGAESIREAVFALLIAFPRYRSYIQPGRPPREVDVTLWQEVAEKAAQGLRSDRVVRALVEAILRSETAEEAALTRRFQQVSGALLAKAQEDTAGFRWVPCLAANEVGAEPDEPAWDAAQFLDWAATRGSRGLTLTSSHDTKRSEDARMRLVALTHCPDDFAALWARARALPEATAPDPNQCWYILQSLIALWQPGGHPIAQDLADRLVQHTEKALREAKETTTWAHPDAEVEEAAAAFARALVADWTRDEPPQLAPILAAGEALSRLQLELKLALPGVPDFYQGAEGALLDLTDPDNRRPVSPAEMEALCSSSGAAGAKCRLTRARLTGAEPDDRDLPPTDPSARIMARYAPLLDRCREQSLGISPGAGAV